jgi:Flp pilus assembly protein TadG
MVPRRAGNAEIKVQCHASAPWERGRGSIRGDAGSATVEFALGLPSLVMVLAFALSAVSWALDIESAQRGAAEAARAAIVESDEVAAAVATTSSGEREVSIVRSGGFVTACVIVTRAPWPAVVRCATAWDQP